MKLSELWTYFQNDEDFINKRNKAILIICACLIGSWWLHRENTVKQGILIKEETQRLSMQQFITDVRAEEMEFAKMENLRNIPRPFNKAELQQLPSELTSKAKGYGLSLTQAILENNNNEYSVNATVEGDWVKTLPFLSSLESGSRLGNVQQIKVENPKGAVITNFKFKIYVQ